MTLESYIRSFEGKRILVVGDVMIDAYLKGKVTRISPEAPVPIVNFSAREERLGGAANVALNIQALGGIPVLTSVIGDDDEGNRLEKLLIDHGMESTGMVRSTGRMTTVKTRVIGNNQQLLRVDREQTNAISSEEEQSLINRVSELFQQGLDAVIFEDYNKGTLTPRVIRELIQLAQIHQVPSAVDPKKENFFEYKGVTLFKPNLKELKEGLNVEFEFSRGGAFEEAVAELEAILNPSISFITLSEHGVFIKSDTEKHYVPAHLRNIADVSGAGDTVISVAALCLASAVPIDALAQLSNLAGGLVCEKVGVISINKEELIHEANKLNR
jgi:D-glycero-beta-D-manno-heptose-7-phosphate kinase